ANGTHTYVEYARYADDLVILVNNDRRQDWLVEAVARRLRGGVVRLGGGLDGGKSRGGGVSRGGGWGFVGFAVRGHRPLRGRWRGGGGGSTGGRGTGGGRWGGGSRRCSNSTTRSRWDG